MITERRAVTILAIATVILVGFLLFADDEEGVDDPAPPSAVSTVETTNDPAASSAVPNLAVEPVGAGRCPKGFRIKGEVSTQGEKVYHLPGEATYGDTRAQECFATISDAEAADYVGGAA